MGLRAETSSQKVNSGNYYYGISKRTGKPIIPSVDAYKGSCSPIKKPIWARSSFIIAFWVVVLVSMLCSRR